MVSIGESAAKGVNNMKRNIPVFSMLALLALAQTGCLTPKPPLHFVASGKEVLETHFFLNGNKKIERELKFGRLDGMVTTWRSTGEKRSEVVYVAGIRNGMSTFWWKNGEKMWECDFRNTKKHGAEKSWHNNGQQKSEYVYVNDVKHGPFAS